MNTTYTKQQPPASLPQATCSEVIARARKNLRKWGRQDLTTLGLAVAEETGELAQAILQYEWEHGDRDRIREEAIDLAALCLQVLEHFPNPKLSDGPYTKP